MKIMKMKEPSARDINLEIQQTANKININYDKCAQKKCIPFAKCAKCERPLNIDYVKYWHNDSQQRHLFCNAECSYAWWSANGLI